MSESGTRNLKQPRSLMPHFYFVTSVCLLLCKKKIGTVMPHVVWPISLPPHPNGVTYQCVNSGTAMTAFAGEHGCPICVAQRKFNRRMSAYECSVFTCSGFPSDGSLSALESFLFVLGRGWSGLRWVGNSPPLFWVHQPHFCMIYLAQSSLRIGVSRWLVHAETS